MNRPETAPEVRTDGLAKRLARLAGRFPGLALLLWILAIQHFGPFSFYNPVGTLDPWIYTSYFRDTPDMIERFGYTYYGSRVSYTLPGALVYRIFEPVLANHVINTLLLLLATYSVYRVLERYHGRTPALGFSIALAPNMALVGAVAWDYPDGPAIAYLLAGLWIHMAPPRPLSRPAALAFSGALYACSGHAMMIAGLVIAPAVLAQAAFIPWKEGLARGARRLVLDWVTIVAGAVACTLLLGVASWAIGGQFLFFKPQLRQTIWSFTDDNLGRWRLPVSQWLPSAPRLIAPAATAIIAGALALLRPAAMERHDLLRGVVWLLLPTTALYALFGIGLGSLVLQIHYHGVFVYVPTFLLCGVLFCRGWTAGSPAAPLLVGAGIGLAMLAAYSARFSRPEWMVPAFVAASIAAACIALYGALREARTGPGVPTIMFVLAPLMLLAIPPAADESSNRVREGDEASFRAALHIQDLVRAGVGRKRNIRYWFDGGEPLARHFDSIALYLWRFPSQITGLLHEPATLRETVDANTTLVVLSEDPSRAQANLEVLAKVGVRARVTSQTDVVVSGRQVHLTIIEVTGSPSRLHARSCAMPRRATPASIPHADAVARRR